MSGKPIESVIKQRGKLLNRWPETFGKLTAIEGVEGARLDINRSVPNIDLSLSELDRRVISLLDLVSNLEGIEDVSHIPSHFLTELIVKLQIMVAQTDDLKTKLNSIEENGGAGAINSEEFTIQSQNESVSLDLKSPFCEQINSAANEALANFYFISMISSGEGFDGFSAATKEFAQQLEKVRATEKALAKSLEENQKALNDVRKQAEQIAAVLTETQEQKEETTRLREEAERDRKTTAEYTGEGTEKIASIRETSGQAEQLKATIEGYQSQFDSFQNQLDEREKAFRVGSEKQAALISKLEEGEQEIARLMADAEKMLSGATVAGLAGSFGIIRDKLAKELIFARIAFYTAIGLLALAVAPLLFLVVPVIDPFSTTQHSMTEAEFATQAAIRFLLLIPAAWFASFAASRHAQLFRLKEHYAYKYSIASSVEGFKKQAEPFKDAIAAATFFELTFNPANRMEAKGRGERPPNPAMDWLMKKLGATYDGERD